MFEKVNPMHVDKIADRIAGAIVDIAYLQEENPKVAVEVLIGHGECNIIIESSINFNRPELKSNITDKVKEISKQDNIKVRIKSVKQDVYLAENQSEEIRCGDNGIFKGVPLTNEEIALCAIARNIYEKYPYDGKYVLDAKAKKLVICQSNAKNEDLRKMYTDAIINPLGEWTGGTDVDTGATNRKLGSDMAQSVTGGGLMGKDLSKADVSVNIYCFFEAQKLHHTITANCAIGDKEITFRVDDSEKDTFTVPYSEVVKIAKEYIKCVGGFEKFAEWGLC